MRRKTPNVASSMKQFPAPDQLRVFRNWASVVRAGRGTWRRMFMDLPRRADWFQKIIKSRNRTKKQKWACRRCRDGRWIAVGTTAPTYKHTRMEWHQFGVLSRGKFITNSCICRPSIIKIIIYTLNSISINNNAIILPCPSIPTSPQVLAYITMKIIS